ncbi:MAG TPA: hypothetical protein VED20_00405 [Streptosporangiaceae bacterium]|nr:hypothetical protein [Streptosporangiaceae bacterium]
MPDRPSNQGLPDDWSHGSYSARGMVLEFFVVAFRVAEDIRVLRERSERGL